MKKNGLAWLVAAAIVAGPASAGVNQWTPAGPDGGSFRAVRYLGNGVALAVTMRSIFRTADHGVTWKVERMSWWPTPQNSRQSTVYMPAR